MVTIINLCCAVNFFGAGSVVVKNIPDSVTIFGNPAHKNMISKMISGK